jgi:hypothetical protein
MSMSNRRAVLGFVLASCFFASGARPGNLRHTQAALALTAQANTQLSGQDPAAKRPKVESVVYRNVDYGFSITLPATWKGFSILKSE